MRRRQDLDDAPDLLVAADDRVELALAGGSVRSRPYFSSAWYLASGFASVTRWLPRTSLSASSTRSCVDAQALQRLTGVAVVGGHREQQVLGGDVLVAERLRLLLRLLQHAAEARGRADLHVAGDLRLLARARCRARCSLLRAARRARSNARDDAALLFDERRGEMLDVDLAVAVLARAAAR